MPLRAPPLLIRLPKDEGSVEKTYSESSRRSQSPMTSDLARELRAIREEAGLTRAEVGSWLGLTPTGYQHYEDRLKKPYLPAPMVATLAENFREKGISVERLMAIGYRPPSNQPDLIDVLRDIADAIRELTAEVRDARRAGAEPQPKSRAAARRNYPGPAAPLT